MSSRKPMHAEKRKSWPPAVKNKRRMIEAAIGVRCVLCFAGTPLTFLVSPAILNLFDNPVTLLFKPIKQG